MSFPVVYDTATTPTKGPQPGAVALRDWILANYSQLGDLGIYNNRSVRGGQSLSTHAEGRAIDIGTPSETAPTPEARNDGRNLRRHLIAHHAELGVQLIIFDRLVWSAVRHDEGLRPYRGSNPHRGHLHIELNRAAAVALTPSMILDALGAPMPPTPDPKIVAIQKRIALAWFAHAWWLPHRPLIDPGDVDSVRHYADGDWGDQSQSDFEDAMIVAERGGDPDPATIEAAKRWREHAALVRLAYEEAG